MFQNCGAKVCVKASKGGGEGRGKEGLLSILEPWLKSV